MKAFAIEFFFTKLATHERLNKETFLKNRAMNM